MSPIHSILQRTPCQWSRKPCGRPLCRCLAERKTNAGPRPTEIRPPSCSSLPFYYVIAARAQMIWVCQWGECLSRPQALKQKTRGLSLWRNPLPIHRSANFLLQKDIRTYILKGRFCPCLLWLLSCRLGKKRFPYLATRPLHLLPAKM